MERKKDKSRNNKGEGTKPVAAAAPVDGGAGLQPAAAAAAAEDADWLSASEPAAAAANQVTAAAANQVTAAPEAEDADWLSASEPAAAAAANQVTPAPADDDDDWSSEIKPAAAAPTQPTPVAADDDDWLSEIEPAAAAPTQPTPVAAEQPTPAPAANQVTPTPADDDWSSEIEPAAAAPTQPTPVAAPAPLQLAVAPGPRLEKYKQWTDTPRTLNSLQLLGEYFAPLGNQVNTKFGDTFKLFATKLELNPETTKTGLSFAQSLDDFHVKIMADHSPIIKKMDAIFSQLMQQKSLEYSKLSLDEQIPCAPAFGLTNTQGFMHAFVASCMLTGDKDLPQSKFTKILIRKENAIHIFPQIWQEIKDASNLHLSYPSIPFSLYHSKFYEIPRDQDKASLNKLFEDSLKAELAYVLLPKNAKSEVKSPINDKNEHDNFILASQKSAIPSSLYRDFTTHLNPQADLFLKKQSEQTTVTVDNPLDLSLFEGPVKKALEAYRGSLKASIKTLEDADQNLKNIIINHREKEEAMKSLYHKLCEVLQNKGLTHEFKVEDLNWDLSLKIMRSSAINGELQATMNQYLPQHLDASEFVDRNQKFYEVREHATSLGGLLLEMKCKANGFTQAFNGLKNFKPEDQRVENANNNWEQVWAFYENQNFGGSALYAELSAVFGKSRALNQEGVVALTQEMSIAKKTLTDALVAFESKISETMILQVLYEHAVVLPEMKLQLALTPPEKDGQHDPSLFAITHNSEEFLNTVKKNLSELHWMWAKAPGEHEEKIILADHDNPQPADDTPNSPAGEIILADHDNPQPAESAGSHAGSGPVNDENAGENYW
jgi:hypothetical protein